MNGYPEDIMQAASMAMAGREYITGDLHQAFIEDVADALVAERERCARIAETEAEQHASDGGWIAQNIVKRIRGEA